jgi:6-phosphogluconolactonase
MSKVETLVLSNRDELVAAASQRIFERLEVLLMARQDLHIAITGGTVGTLTLEALSELTKDMDLSRLHIWWVDERFVPRESSERNELQARNAWLAGSGIVERNIHAFPADKSVSIEQAAQLFARDIEAINPEFSLVLLGMGEDGHVASLFPDSAADGVGDFVVVEQNSPKAPKKRLSLSMRAINRSNEVLFLVSGKEKAEAVAQARSGLGNLPASRVSGRNATTWLLDEDAASMITSS